jgi:hypothetical protein
MATPPVLQKDQRVTILAREGRLISFVAQLFAHEANGNPGGWPGQWKAQMGGLELAVGNGGEVVGSERARGQPTGVDEIWFG